MKEYITPDTALPESYYQVPRTVLDLPVSQTAKLAYILLYDRMRLSYKNRWVRNGRVYTVYPIAEMAKKLGKTETRIKAVFKELAEAGLLECESGGFGRADILYVFLPEIEAAGQETEGEQDSL